MLFNPLFIEKRNKRVINVPEIEALSDVEVDSEHERAALKKTSSLILPANVGDLVDVNFKPTVYLEESSSCSELGKDVNALDATREPPCANTFLAITPREAAG